MTLKKDSLVNDECQKVRSGVLFRHPLIDCDRVFDNRGNTGPLRLRPPKGSQKNTANANYGSVCGENIFEARRLLKTGYKSRGKCPFWDLYSEIRGTIYAEYTEQTNPVNDIIESTIINWSITKGSTSDEHDITLTVPPVFASPWGTSGEGGMKVRIWIDDPEPENLCTPVPIFARIWDWKWGVQPNYHWTPEDQEGRTFNHGCDGPPSPPPVPQHYGTHFKVTNFFLGTPGIGVALVMTNYASIQLTEYVPV